MHIEFLVEEPSAAAALHNIVPRILGSDVSFNIHAYQGKLDLLAKLHARLRGYRTWLPEDWRIVVLIDADQQDCRELKRRMEDAAQQAGLMTKTAAQGGRFQVLNRLAIEELEAWFFGDVAALHAAYPRVPFSLEKRSAYRVPDAIQGGTWEALERELKRAGHFQGGLEKVAAARKISMHMQPTQNRSRSIQVFRNGLLALKP